ncbi:MAG TPA: helix-turn-helix domain-containing protein [Candidatus Lokiarchaeia archaeon]|nr:helix-turn-helix domain-containing protein [Candidatus Lokiarchaeia archaeon]
MSEDLSVVPENTIEKTLEAAGFSVFLNLKYRAFCFDIIARKDNNLIIIKVAPNIDRLKTVQTDELKFLSHVLQATPIIIGEKNRRDPLEDDTIYKRDEVIVLNLNTFRNLILYNQNPHIIAKRGGFIVRIDGPKLRQIREAQNVSRSTIAAELGVSKKAIVNYEQDRMNIKLESMEVLKKRFKVDFTVPVEILQFQPKVELPARQGESSFEKEVDEELVKLGFRTFWTKAAPFDLFLNQITQPDIDAGNNIKALTAWPHPIITGVAESEKSDLDKKIEVVSKLAEIKNKVLVIVDDASQIDSNAQIGVPLVEQDELKKFSSSTDLMRLVEKRSRKKKQDDAPP